MSIIDSLKKFLKDNADFLNPFRHIDKPKHALHAHAKRTTLRQNLYKVRRSNTSAKLQDVDPLALLDTPLPLSNGSSYILLGIYLRKLYDCDIPVSFLSVTQDKENKTLRFSRPGSLNRLPNEVANINFTFKYKSTAQQLQLAAALGRNMAGMLDVLETYANQPGATITENDINELMNPTQAFI